MFARVARYRVPDDAIDEAIRGFETAVEELRQLDGNVGGYILVDRDNCTAISVTLWENRVAMESSEVKASRLRSQAVAGAGGEIQAVDRCEVVLDFSDQTRV